MVKREVREGPSAADHYDIGELRGCSDEISGGVNQRSWIISVSRGVWILLCDLARPIFFVIFGRGGDPLRFYIWSGTFLSTMFITEINRPCSPPIDGALAIRRAEYPLRKDVANWCEFAAMRRYTGGR